MIEYAKTAASKRRKSENSFRDTGCGDIHVTCDDIRSRGGRTAVRYDRRDSNAAGDKEKTIDTTSGGYVILNQGLDSERIIKEKEKDGVKEFKIYDGENILLD